MYLVGAPLLVIPFAIYNIVAFLMPGVSWSAPLTHVQLMSGAEWTMSAGDILVGITALILIVEVVKSARAGARSFVDHGLAWLLVIGMAAEFVWVPQAASATFFLMLVIALVEAVIGIGMALRLRAQRRGQELLIEPETPPAAAAVEVRPDPPLEPAPNAPPSG
jgi:hypothetical protein